MTKGNDEFVSLKYHYKVGVDVTGYEDWEEVVEEIIPDLDDASDLPLGLIDRTMPRYWVSTVYVFPPCETSLDEDQLKHSLKCSLGLLPALSGRLKTPSGTPYDFESHPKDLHIKLGTTGAWFTSQQTKSSFDEIESSLNSSEPLVRPVYLFQAAEREILTSESPPLLAIKLLNSSDGGHFLTIMRSHLIVDGRSNCLFLRMWSQFYRRISIDPVIDNRFLYAKTKNLSDGAQQFLNEWAHPREVFKCNSGFQTVTFSITKTDMLELKQSLLNQYNSKEEWVSTDDILSVIAWRVLMRAWKFDQHKSTSFQRVVDIRKLSQIPSNSYGCGVLIFSYPDITIQHLLETPLATLALNFRRILQETLTQKKVEDYLIALSHTSKPHLGTHILNSFHGPHILASSYIKFNQEDAHFHRPATTALRSPYLPGRLHTHFPTPTDYHMRIGVPTQIIPGLLKDSELKKWKFQAKVTSPPIIPIS